MRKISLIFFSMILLIGFVNAQDLFVDSFDSSEDWQELNANSYGVTDGIYNYSVIPSSDDPFISKTIPPYGAMIGDILEIRYKIVNLTSCEADGCNDVVLSWINENCTVFGNDCSILSENVSVLDGEYHILSVNLNHVNYSGNISQLRLDIPSSKDIGEEIDVFIDYIRISGDRLVIEEEIEEEANETNVTVTEPEVSTVSGIDLMIWNYSTVPRIDNILVNEYFDFKFLIKNIGDTNTSKYFYYTVYLGTDTSNKLFEGVVSQILGPGETYPVVYRLKAPSSTGQYNYRIKIDYHENTNYNNVILESNEANNELLIPITFGKNIRGCCKDSVNDGWEIEQSKCSSELDYPATYLHDGPCTAEDRVKRVFECYPGEYKRCDCSGLMIGEAYCNDKGILGRCECVQAAPFMIKRLVIVILAVAVIIILVVLYLKYGRKKKEHVVHHKKQPIKLLSGKSKKKKSKKRK